MEKQPLEETFNKTVKDLQRSINVAMNQLQQGVHEYLSNSIDIKQLLKMIEGMGISNIMGMPTTPMPGIDYYKVLGLDKTASDDEITKRYREIIRKIHPDVAGKEMTFLTTLVNTAYEMIWKERGMK